MPAVSLSNVNGLADEPVHFLVPAAGAGTRFGGSVPKQFLRFAGRPLVEWTVRRLLEAGATSVTVAVPEDSLESARAELGGLPGVRCVAGGGTRQASVALALAASPAAAAELVAAHDGARPAVAKEDLRRTCRAAAMPDADGALLGRAVADTLKLVADGRIVATVDRSRLFRAETPQVFRRSVLERAFQAAAETRFVGTDEASLVERLPGIRIVAVEAQSPNPKVTTPADVAIVEALLAATSDPEAVREWR